jgi:hypothetical protein
MRFLTVQPQKSPNLPISAKADLARIQDELLISLERVSIDHEQVRNPILVPRAAAAPRPNSLVVVLIICVLVACLVAALVRIKRHKEPLSQKAKDQQ